MNIMKNQKTITISQILTLNPNTILDQLVKTCLLLKNKPIVPRDPDNSPYMPNPLYQVKSTISGYERIYPRLRKLSSVIGIDSSVYSIAESDDGYVLVTCGALVVEENINDVKVYRYGPIPIYISPSSISSLQHLISIFIGNISNDTINLVTKNLNYAKRLIIILIESLLITYAIELAETNSIILIDGSLQRFKRLTNLLHKAYSKNVYVVGVSKRSKLYKYFPNILYEVVSSPLPVVIKLQDLPIKYRIRGISTYIGKLHKHGIPLRIDFHDKYDPHIIIDSIFSNSYEPTGYPNVLKEAHIGAKILRSELIGIKLTLSKLGVVFKYSPKFRDFLFGPFNKSSSEWVYRNVNI